MFFNTYLFFVLVSKNRIIVIIIDFTYELVILLNHLISVL